MSDLTDLYNRVKQVREASRPDIATKSERDRLIEDRRNDPPVPEHNYPAPEWETNPNSLIRQQMRNREARINDLNGRLGRASRKVNRDFDRSR